MSEVNYGTYLKLGPLLDQQQVLSDPPEHDELLFIIVHQTYELWFKQLLHEFDEINRLFAENDLFAALAAWKRVRTIMKTLVGQLDIIETMTPRSFAAFRDRLETASGFQSTQFRTLEFALGDKRPETLNFYNEDMYGYDELKRSLDAPSVMDAFIGFLHQRGMNEDVAGTAGPRHAPREVDSRLQDELLRLCTEQPDLDLLCESMMDFDQGLQEWRYRHVKMVERAIGNKKGSGGSLGVEFLKRRLFHAAFPDLWAIRHRF
jgi:tryptophan 2,3-dioxygenase